MFVENENQVSGPGSMHRDAVGGDVWMGTLTRNGSNFRVFSCQVLVKQSQNLQKAHLAFLDHFFAESLANLAAECHYMPFCGAPWCSIRQGSILQWHRFSDGQETQGWMQMVGLLGARDLRGTLDSRSQKL